jgi:TolB-like protein/Flp pilus assembly protein TadD
MGEVWRARDSRLGRDVAIKVLSGELAADGDRLRRFKREARAAGCLNHPNILTIFDIGSLDGTPYLVLELLEGETMRERLGRGRLPVERAVDYATQVARGLAAAHQHRIVHRDLKPENLFVTRDERVKILDFGLAKLVQPNPADLDAGEAPTADGVTVARAVVGTAGYMSPEQAFGEAVDLRSDVFAFGAVLFEMLTGRRAFLRATSPAMWYERATEEPPDLSTQAWNVPPAIARVVRRCLARRPDERYEDAVSLLADLQAMSAPAALPGGTAGSELASTGRRVMLVVLPFDNLSRDPAQEYFSDGLTEETITALGGVAADRLGVIARTSAMSYKGARKSIAEIGRELGADFALEGSVRRQGDRVRINVQLIRTGDQAQVWAQKYDREIKDVLAVQDELGRAIADQVQVKVTPPAAAAFAAMPTVDQTAYDAYLRGRFHLWRVTRSSLERAIDYFSRALAIDPGMAVALAGLSQARVILPIAADVAPREAFPLAERAALDALALDPESAEAHSALASLRFWNDWDWAQSEAHSRRAIARNPSYARAHQVLGRTLTNIGRFDEAFAEIDVAGRLDPFAQLIAVLAGDFRFQARRYGEVPGLIRRALEIDSNFWVAHVLAARFFLHQGQHEEALAEARLAKEGSGAHSEPVSLIGCILGRMGRRREAEAVLLELEQRAADRYVPPSASAVVHLGLGDVEAALASLERAYGERDVHLLELGVEPKWDELRGHPRFRELIRAIGLPVG